MNNRGMSILFLLVATYASDDQHKWDDAHNHASGNHYNEEGDHGLLRKIKDGRTKRDQLTKDVAAESATLEQINGPNHKTMLTQIAELDKRDRAVDATMGLDTEQRRLLHQGYTQQKDATASAWQQSKDAAVSKLASLQQELTTTKADIEKNEHTLTDLEVRIGLYHTNTYDDFSHAPWVQVWTIPTMASRFDVFTHAFGTKPHGSAAVCPLDQSEMTGLLEKARLTKDASGVYNQDPTAKTMQISKIELSNAHTWAHDQYIFVTYKDGSRIWYKQPRGGRMRDRADTWIRGYHYTAKGHHENGHYLVDPVNKPIDSYADELLVLRPKATWTENCGTCHGHGYMGYGLYGHLPSFSSHPGKRGFLARLCWTCNGAGNVTKTDKTDQDFTYIGCRTTADKVFGGFAYGGAGILTAGVGAGVFVIGLAASEVGMIVGGFVAIVVGVGAVIGGFVRSFG